ncbi:unnamed protein product [Hermetia illucens]|uniref:Uncharacterized protein n=1 Tax=Hermetia illucens TaxID=343691 RepID=A0A7R8UUW1_HERIL|nr:unnamed protein product [Hermetia illucens]
MAKRTIMIVSEIQRNCKDDFIMSRMEKFWQQLIADNTNFSACGMCTINRQILTSTDRRDQFDSCMARPSFKDTEPRKTSSYSEEQGHIQFAQYAPIQSGSRIMA